jgi:hypothetical protein
MFSSLARGSEHGSLFPSPACGRGQGEASWFTVSENPHLALRADFSRKREK